MEQEIDPLIQEASIRCLSLTTIKVYKDQSDHALEMTLFNVM